MNDLYFLCFGGERYGFGALMACLKCYRLYMSKMLVVLFTLDSLN